jgi:hypothetical protein
LPGQLKTLTLKRFQEVVMSHQNITEAQQTAIEETVRALTNAALAAAEQVDVDGLFAICSDASDVGFIDNSVFYPSLDAMISAFRSSFSQLQRQEIEVSETRVAVLASNVVVQTVHGNATALFQDGNRWASPWAWTLVYAKVGDNWTCVHAHQSFPHES